LQTNEDQMQSHVAIRQLGMHRGKQLIFGFDRYLLPEFDAYLGVLSQYGIAVPAVNGDSPHYLTSAQRVCERVRGRADAVGVLFCNTGMGMSIAANKFSGIYAARCLSVDDAEMARSINNANVLCLAVREGLAQNQRIVDAFMTTAYDGRKLEQLEYITCMELETDPAPAGAARLRTRMA
jgi:RpiB/LacA/LacB family sugar-phosphate isomerase